MPIERRQIATLRLLACAHLVACAASQDSGTGSGAPAVGAGTVGTTPGIVDITPSDCELEGPGVPSPHLHLRGAAGCDTAGDQVLAMDLDGDGLDEVFVASDRRFAPNPYTYGPLTAVHGFTGAPAQSGTLGAGADVVELRGAGGADAWGRTLSAVPGGRLLVGGIGQPRAVAHLFEPAMPLQGTLSADDATAILEDVLGDPYWGLEGQQAFPCATADGVARLCHAAAQNPTLDSFDFPGQILLYDAAATGSVPVVGGVLARVIGEPGDSARFGTADADLTGDGVVDLLIGAYSRNEVGAAAIVPAPTPGEHPLWTAAVATFDGVDSLAAFGLTVATGDLDDDGVVDVFIGAPSGSGAVYGFRGPHSGARSAAEADWVFASSESNHGFGRALALADFDGDGTADLAIGAPRTPYDATEPGAVYAFASSPPGTRAPTDADAVLDAGPGLPDSFGSVLEPAQLDGDPAMELLVGAPRTSVDHHEQGAVYFFDDILGP